jgi:hypothetical protein
VPQGSLATARSADDQEGPFVDYLLALFAKRQLDLIMTLGCPAAWGIGFRRLSDSAWRSDLLSISLPQRNRAAWRMPGDVGGRADKS